MKVRKKISKRKRKVREERDLEKDKKILSHRRKRKVNK